MGRHGTAGDLLALGALFNAMGVFWLLSYAVLAARARAVLGRPAVKRTLDRVTGTVLVGLGVRLALEHRHLGRVSMARDIFEHHNAEENPPCTQS